MLGNVYEWCLNKNLGPKAPTCIAIDNSNTPRRIRGGSWKDSSSHLPLISGKKADPVSQTDWIGFRVACEIEKI